MKIVFAYIINDVINDIAKNVTNIFDEIVAFNVKINVKNINIYNKNIDFNVNDNK